MENLEMPPGPQTPWSDIMLRVALIAGVVTVFFLLVKWAQAVPAPI
jgi:hypothetical protein